jgi:hypothetical protein
VAAAVQELTQEEEEIRESLATLRWLTATSSFPLAARRTILGLVGKEASALRVS